MCVLGTDNLFYKVLSTQGGYLGVAVFFFLSGFGLMESDIKRHLTLFQFLKKRLSKIYLPAVLVTAIWLPICCLALKHDLSIGLWGG
jgi:peptidoglycan/LPS O-acetylase OafA/YrhL